MEIIEALVIVQARMSSTRLPGKVLELVNGMPVIYWQIERIKKSSMNLRIVVATSNDASDDQLVNFLISKNIEVFRGSLDNVYSRFIEVAKSLKYEIIVRSTADCPLFMPEILDEMLRDFVRSEVDYLSNTNPPTYPDGLDIEIFKFDALTSLESRDLTKMEKEHVTYGIYTRPEEFTLKNYSNKENLSNLRWTLDYFEDLLFIRQVFKNWIRSEDKFGFEDLLVFLRENTSLHSEIEGNRRNEQLERLENGDN